MYQQIPRENDRNIKDDDTIFQRANQTTTCYWFRPGSSLAHGISIYFSLIDTKLLVDARVDGSSSSAAAAVEVARAQPVSYTHLTLPTKA